MKTKRNSNNKKYCELLKLINEWQEKHPGEEYPRGWGRKLRNIAKRYASRPRGEKE